VNYASKYWRSYMEHTLLSHSVFTFTERTYITVTFFIVFFIEFVYGTYRVTHGNLTSFEWVVLRTAPKKNELCQCVVSTRWCHSAHCKRINDHCSKLSGAPHFPFRRRAVAPSLSQSFNM